MANTDPWTERWNERYRRSDYAYGETPNDYLREQLDQLTPGRILFPAEGEGRNAVYAAKSGWTVSAFDISDEGRKKALQLAAKNNVTIDYRVGTLDTMGYALHQFDVIALIYAHFPAAIKTALNQALATHLRPGGVIIFEAFSKNHLAYIARNEKVGGPRDVESLYSIDEIKSAFPNFEALELIEKEIELSEGSFHQGTGSVIRFLGRKK